MLDEILKAFDDLPFGDPEAAHAEADRLLIEALGHLGRDDIALAWEQACERIGFWYA